jgi:hypothetical protein
VACRGPRSTRSGKLPVWHRIATDCSSSPTLNAAIALRSAFVDKTLDVVGLYVDPPAHAVVLSIDEKSQIQALDRTQPGLPLKPGRLSTLTHLCTPPAWQELS